MPGVLKHMSNSSDLKSGGFVLDTNATAMAEGTLKKEMPTSLSNGIARPNGTDPMANGTHANGDVADIAMTPDLLAANVEKVLRLLPPEIEHITYGYLPLSRLITRLAQDTHNELGKVINEIADMQTPQPNNALPYLNGAGASQNSQINVQKKERLWNFAQDRRAKFIKVLVLSQWSRQAEAVGKVIDLNVWMENQKRLYDDATAWIGELKRLLGPVKMPSPDLKTALEVLSTGKASWLPDLGYLPPEPLSPQRLLKALRTVNTLLTIRLNLHENIPPSFRNFFIASGRATFKVDDEFELDLSIANEDPSSQLYFIDFRFLFGPCLTKIPPGRLRDEIEGKTNNLLSREGLNGCFNFLHDLVLTHKLSILRQQAFELVRGRWSENLRVEVLHRSLVVQYWLNRPGGKNWVEIGIKRGKRKEKTASWKGLGIPFISFRWHRHGKEVLNSDINLDLGHLSIEILLRQVIAAHTNNILKETKKKLREGLLYSKKSLSVKHKASRTEPADCSLRVQLTSKSTITITQEPISGNFAIIPLSGLHNRMERDLNSFKDPAVESSLRIAQLRCLTAVDEVEFTARLIGWEPVKTLIPSAEAVKKWFSMDTMRLAFFRIKNWDNLWMIAFTSGMSGDGWWVTRLYNKTLTTNTTNPKTIHGDDLVTAFRISFSNSGTIEPSNLILSHVENAAAAIISQFTDTRYLVNFKKSYMQQQPYKSRSSTIIPDLYIRFSEFYAPLNNKAWCHEIIKLTFVGLSRFRDSVIHIASARLVTPIAAISTLTSTPDSSVSFHQTSGAFAFRLLTPVDKPTIPSLLERLRRIERLVRFLTIIERHHLQCETVSLNRLVFTYGVNPAFQPLKAEINFANDSPVRIQFERDNPHLRVQDFLTTVLNSDGGFEYVAYLLHVTLPILRAFAAIESSMDRDGSSSNVCILTRSAIWYRIKYERPKALFEIRLRQRADEPLWSLLMVEGPPVGKEDEGNGVTEVWKRLCQENSQNWKVMKGTIVAGTEYVEVLLHKIDETLKDLDKDTRSDHGGMVEDGRNTNIEGSNDVVVLD